MITKLCVRNFKSIEDSGHIELRPLTILTGPNGSGKSNILEAMGVLAQTSRLDGSITPSLLGSLEYGVFFKYPHPSLDYIAHKKELSKKISFSLWVDVSDREANQIIEIAKELIAPDLTGEVIKSVGFSHSYTPKEETADQSLVINDKRVVDIIRDRVGPSSYRDVIAYPKGLDDLARCTYVSEILNPRAFEFEPRPGAKLPGEVAVISSLAKKIIEIIRGRLRNLYYISAMRGIVELKADAGGDPLWVGKSGEHLIEILSKCYGSRRYEEKVLKISNWAEMFGISGLKAGFLGGGKIGADYMDPKLMSPLELALASYGTRQILSIIVQIFWGEPGDIILIEEPEISLHPESQVTLQELFSEAIREGKQIIYSTHSTFLVRALSLVVKSGKLPRDSVAVYHVEKGGAGTKVERLELDEQGFLKGWIPSYIEVEDKLFREWAETLKEEE